MPPHIAVFILILALAPTTGYGLEINPKDILLEKYSRELFPEQFEYAKNIEKYKLARKAKKNTCQKLDSLILFKTFPMWPEEEQRRLKHIINLGKNDQSGDVYRHMKELGTEYAFTLNKIINLNDVYVLERAVIKSCNAMKEAEEWAERVATIANFFYEDFIKGNLKNDMYYYISVLAVEEQIQEIEKKYNYNIGLLILDDEEKARGLYYSWKRRVSDIKPSPAREFLLLQLEKRFTKSFSK